MGWKRLRLTTKKAEDKTSAFLFSDSFEGMVEFKAQKIENFGKKIQKYVKNTYHCVYFDVKT